MREGNRSEAQMIRPIHELMLRGMRLDAVSAEFSAGYGFADLVGGEVAPAVRIRRCAVGVPEPLDHRLLVKTLLAVRPRDRSDCVHWHSVGAYVARALSRGVQGRALGDHGW